MDEFIQQAMNGFAIGGIYALIALGYTMVYGVLKLINFAHGDLFALGAYLGFSFCISYGISLNVPVPLIIVLAFIVVFVSVSVIGVVLERVAYRPLRKSNRLSVIVSALGASIFLQNAIMLLYGARFHVYPEIFRSSTFVSIMGVQTPVMRLAIIGCSVVLMLALYYFIHKTQIGMAIRAVAIDQDTARLMGINIDRVIALVFFIGAGLGGIAGVMVGIYYGQIAFTMGWVYGLKAFTAAILGGIGNIPGAMLGGLLLGLIEAMASSYISVAWKDAIAFLVLIIILLIRPKGLLGERVVDKL